MSLDMLRTAGIFLFFFGVFFFLFFLVPRKKAQELKKQYDDDGFQVGEEARFVFIFKPFYQFFLPLIKRLPMTGYKDKVVRYAVTAGLEKDVTAEDIIGFQFSVALLFAVLSFVLFNSVLIILVAVLVGLVYPYLWLYEKKKRRQVLILTGMPDVVDMLSLSVEAGLEFNAATRKVCEIYKEEREPFVMELYLLNQNLKLGLSREEALRNMAERVDMQELYAFTSILIQAEKMGSSISSVLKSQAVRIRQERFMKAERAGAVASQKLLVPMILLIFPVLFIVIFAPFVLRFIYG